MEAEKLSDGSLWVVVIAKPFWKPFFRRVLDQRAGYKRETSLGLVKDARLRGKRILPLAA